MAARAHWKGYLKLSLVSCPIVLYPAVSAAERISFRQVNRQTGNRLRQQMVDTITGEVVRSHDKGRGYEIGGRQLLPVQDEELEAAQQISRTKPVAAETIPPVEEPPASRPVTARREEGPPSQRRNVARREEVRRVEIKYPEPEPEPAPPPVRVENNRTIEIERFFPVSQIDVRYHDTPYYIAPRDEIGQEAFAVIRDAMGGEEMVGMGRVVLTKREHPIILRPLGKGLLGMTLRYAHEIRNEADYFAGIPELELPEEMLQVARHILDTKAADFDPALLEDRYRTALVSMLREKQAELQGRTPPAAVPPSQNVINLMDALKRSLENARPGSTTRKPSQGRFPSKLRAKRAPRLLRKSTSHFTSGLLPAEGGTTAPPRRS